MSDKKANHTFADVVFFGKDNGIPALYDTLRVTLFIIDSNRAPIATSSSITIGEDSVVTIELEGFDPDGDSLEWRNKPPAKGSVSGSPPILVYTPKDGFSGRDTIMFDVFDGITASAMVALVINVGYANDVPLARDTTITLKEDDSAQFVLPVYEAENEELQIEIVRSIDITRGTLTYPIGKVKAGEMVIKYKPKQNVNGIDSFTYHVKDSLNTSRNATVTFFIQPNDDKPTCITGIVPSDNAMQVGYLPQAEVSWQEAIDIDGDAIQYVFYYGKSLITMGRSITTTTSVQLAGLEPETRCFWYVQVIAGSDSSRCPVDNSKFYSFTTINYPATIEGFHDYEVTINDSIQLSVAATDKERIKEYRWTIENDAHSPYITEMSAVTVKTPAQSGQYKLTVQVVDYHGGITTDSANLTVTDEKPTVEIGTDTLKIQYKGAVNLAPTANDDGKNLIFEWDFENDGTFVQVSNGDTTFGLPRVDLPYIAPYILKVTDDDGNTALDTVICYAHMHMDKLNSGEVTSNRNAYSVCLHNDAFYVAGGWTDNEFGNFNDVWKSSDAESWEQMNSNAPWPKRFDAGLISYREKLYLIGGTYTNFQVLGRRSDVWESVDGKEWTLKADTSLVERLGTVAPVVHDDAVWMFGNFRESNGILGTTYFNLWIHFGLPSGSDGRKVPVVNCNDTTWFLYGESFKDLWRHTSRNTVTKVVTDTHVEEFSSGDLFIRGDVMWLISDRSIWRTTDRGLNWERVVKHTLWSGEMTSYSSMVEVLEHNSKLYIFTNAGIWTYNGPLD